MAFKDEGKEPEYVKHEWEREWSSVEWQLHETELREIDSDYVKILADTMRTDNPFVSYQKKHGGLNAEGAYVTDSTKDHSNYEVNRWKLEKWQLWKERRMTPEERAASKERIKEILKDINKVNLKV